MEFYHHKTEDYYKKFIELQTKLRRSEEERFALEMKFNKLVHDSKEEKRGHYEKMSIKYKHFLKDDKKRQERNEKLLQSLENIESRINMLVAKTERFNLLRKQYNFFLKRAPLRSGAELSRRRDDNEIRGTFIHNSAEKTEMNAVNEVFNPKTLRDRESESFRRGNYMENIPSTNNFPDYTGYGNYTSFPKSKDVFSNGDLDSGCNYSPRIHSYDKGMNGGLKMQSNVDTNNEEHDVLHRKSIDETGQSLNEIKLTPDKLRKTENEQFMLNNGVDITESTQFRVHEDITPYKKFMEENNNIEECPGGQQIRFNVEVNNNLPAGGEIVKENLEAESFESQEQLNEFVQNTETENVEKTTLNDEKEKHEVVIDEEECEKIIVNEFINNEQSEETVASLEESKDVEIIEKSDINSQMNNNIDKLELDTQNSVPPTQKYVDQFETSNPTQINDNNKPIHQIEENNEPITQQFKENDPLSEQYVENEQTDGQSTQETLENVVEMQNYDESGQVMQNLVQNYDEHPTEQYDQTGQLYDENVQPIQEYEENLQATQQYDENGQPIEQYDDSGQPIHQYDANGQYMQHYDENGQPIQQYDENGQIIEYNEQNQFMEQYDENGQPIQYDQNQQQYDENGQPIQGYDENGQPVGQYDENPDLYQYGNYEQSAQQYYDENGQIVQQYDESGQPVPYTDQQQAYGNEEYANYEVDLSKTSENVNQPSSEITPENGNDGDKAKEPEINQKHPNVMEMLDTDTESVKQDTKVSNDSDFDFSNG